VQTEKLCFDYFKNKIGEVSDLECYTQKKVISKEEEHALSKFLSQFPLDLRVFLSL